MLSNNKSKNEQKKEILNYEDVKKKIEAEIGKRKINDIKDIKIAIENQK